MGAATTRTRAVRLGVWSACAVLTATCAVRAGAKPDAAAARRFVFHDRVAITDLPPRETAHVWIPLPTSNRRQKVAVCKVDLPGEYRKTKEKRHGNRMFFLRAVADDKGRIPIAIEYEIVRKRVTPESGDVVTRRQRRQFLQANRLVPAGGKPFEKLLGGKPPGKSRDAVRAIYDRVDRHVRYHKPAGGQWGRGDAAWVCDSGYGNCTDFHSLFIALCRGSGVPARFLIGFPISHATRGEVGGYHCWAEFAVGRRWFPVDVSEADKHPEKKDAYFGNLPADRVMFSTGRDLVLEPKQKSGPVNFFVYPHVEIDGKVHNKLQKRFAFEAIQ